MAIMFAVGTLMDSPSTSEKHLITGPASLLLERLIGINVFVA
jgi:hypothetical protein